MARHSEEVYGKYGICGSNTYNFNVAGKDKSWEYCKGNKPPAKKKENQETKSPLMLLACLMCAVLLVAGVLSRASLIDLSNETLFLQSELEELKDENTRLKISHASLFPMEETEEYAIEVLGMQKPGPEQIADTKADISSAQKQISEDYPMQGLFGIIRAFFSG